jgi:hypothetical protein
MNNEVWYDNYPDYEDDYYDDEYLDYQYETDYPCGIEDEWLPEYEPISGRSRVVIIAGNVYEVAVITYADGHREGSRRQLEDTCYDGKMPF